MSVSVRLPALAVAAAGLVVLVAALLALTTSSTPQGTLQAAVVDTVDPLPPTLTLPSPEPLVEATSADGALVEFVATSDSPGGPECSPASGTTFPLGMTEVECTVSNESGTTSGTFFVTVVDTTPPVLPDVITVEADGPDGAVVDITATDAVAGQVPAFCMYRPDQVFPLGATLVYCSATDGESEGPLYEQTRLLQGEYDNGFDGNTVFGPVLVRVGDTTAPSISVPDLPPTEAEGPDGAAVEFNRPSARDAVDPSPSLRCDASSGDVFPLGETIVRCTATDDEVGGPLPVEDGPLYDQAIAAVDPCFRSDAATPVTAVTDLGGGIGQLVECRPRLVEPYFTGDNRRTSTFTVTVVDTTPPDLTMPPDQAVEATSERGAPVTFGPPTASDLVDPDPTISCDAASGDTFPLGTTVVTCTATDAAQNTSTGTFTSTVVDTTPPGLTLPPDQIVEATGPDGAPVTFGPPAANDDVNPDPTLDCDAESGDTFPLGTTVVTCTATDGAGLAAASTAAASGNATTGSFTVTVQDTIAPLLDVPDVIEATATSIDGVAVDFPAVTATDVVTITPTVECVPPSGSTFPVGDSMVTCTATDAAGNASSDTFTITVTGDPAVLGVADELAEEPAPAEAEPVLPAAGAETNLLIASALALIGFGTVLLRRRHRLD